MILKVTILAIIIIAIAFAGLAITLLIKKKGQFPETHVGHNIEMKKKGIVCAKTQDKIDQKKAYSNQKHCDLKCESCCED